MVSETHLQQELDRLKENLLKMATLVEETLRDAIKVLVDRDSELIKKTMAQEDRINDMENVIDEMCLKLLALRQPMAIDLRFITSAMKIITDLERMGDQAINIGERAVSLNQEPQIKPYIDIPRMAEIVQSMVKDVLDAFVNRDSTLARSVCERDDIVDGLNDQVHKRTADLHDVGSIDDHPGCSPYDCESLSGADRRSCNQRCRRCHLHGGRACDQAPR